MHLELTIAPAGRDDHPGTPGQPLATLAAARNRLRAERAAGRLGDGARVRLLAGDYRLPGTFTLEAGDGGTAGAPIVYEAASGERVRLLGGRRLEWRSFVPVSDPAVLARFTPGARPHVRQCDLRAAGIHDLGRFASRGFNRPTAPAHLELFVNDRPMTVAQWPNRGEFLPITGYTKPMTDEWGSETGALSGGFTYDGDRPRGWAPNGDLWVHGYWSYDWANSYEHVRRLDPTARVVETDGGLYNFRKGQRFYFLNVLEEIDQPGEYAVERGSGLLYFWPPEPLAVSDILVSEMTTPLVAFRGVSHARLRGVVLEAGRGSGIEVTGGEGVRIEDCTLRNLGNWGVTIEGGTRHAVSGCDIYGTGDGGVRLQGGTRASLTPCHHEAVHNRIHHFARWSRCYVAGVGAGGVGMRIAHNRIHDAPHNAILFWGNDFLIEANEIYRVCLETGDAGAIYTGRDYTFRGNVIRRNFLHHLGGVGMGSMAIYMDDCVSGACIEENILWECQYGLLLGGGRDFVVDNNVFVRCRVAIHADARGVDPSPVWQNMVTKTMKERLDAMRHREPPFRDRYPEIAAVDAHYAAGRGVPPEHIRVSRNISRQCGRWLSDCWPAGSSNGITESGNLVEPADPGFMDEAGGDFRLRPDSPARERGIASIPLAAIGPFPK